MSFLRKLLDTVKPKPGLEALLAQLNGSDPKARLGAAQVLEALENMNALDHSAGAGPA